MANERASLEQRFCPSCGGGNPLVALHCMWCGRHLRAAPAAGPGRGESAGYTAPVEYSMANRPEPRPLSRRQRLVLTAAGQGLIAVGALVSVGLGLVALHYLAMSVYDLTYSRNNAGIAALAMAGLLAAWMLLVLPGYILAEMGRFRAGRSDRGSSQ